MPTKPFATDKYEEPTGRDWAAWLKFAEQEKLANLSHAEIAERFGKAGVSGWWAQNLTVAFEQHIGRRLPGQVGDSFRTQVNRTVPGGREAVAARWAEAHAGTRKIGGVAIDGPATTSDTPKRSYWRITLADGSKVQVAFEPRPGDKTMVNATIDRLGSAEAIEIAKAVWKELLGKL
ncbi:MAG: hypothetical protein J0I48_12650 [Devosia sp.]|uniref:hypothetical protein n=1 Tax=Devosia sp. 66-22 TaxID=1895753 RepID=UPI00092B031E|nr:hypothetical protein [Devosia sp. 66-22]MBN9347029.1 hypothetical protein [Devosia sp.]OJX54690.1 MAG: hypothetical protein BGO81_16350 [Devosia sp. 66-22]